ncbi:substrate-binding periplasmic protein [Uliginosibacterium gangwonense]|uniref:substrate-binding periplasmic protein n=1 Tax=Uliginosibacterium gangwonense TaxID=392736 RepID=UPI0003744D98|nr:transporter substrate-binding domain-containing protein [Uliginosibacterium gangwonense]
MNKYICAVCLGIMSSMAFADEVHVGVFIHSPNVYQDKQTNVIRGPSIDYITTKLRKMGHTPVVVAQPFPRLMLSLENGDVDLTLEIAKNQDRERFAYFSKKPIYIMRPGITVLVGSKLSKIESVNNLNGMTLGFLAGAAIPDFFANQPAVKFDLVSGDDWLAKNLGKLLAGRVDAVFDQNVYSYLAEAKKKNIGDKIKTIPLPVKGTEAFVAFSKKSAVGAKLLKEFDDANDDKVDVINSMIENELAKSDH